MAFDRITVRPDQMGGVPCIRSLRVPVSTAAGMVEDGRSVEESLVAYPDLETEDLSEALRHAAEVLPDRELRRRGGQHVVGSGIARRLRGWNESRPGPIVGCVGTVAIVG
ncbi:MAG: DUF433 domain-containing protein [Planctomycetes bacterium]|nr:DUF433 domain-containing protein [Planctomycetota bacterium]